MGHQLACICEQCSNPLSYPRTHHQATGVCFTLLICVPINMYDIYVIIYTHYIYIHHIVCIYIYVCSVFIYIYTKYLIRNISIRFYCYMLYKMPSIQGWVNWSWSREYLRIFHSFQGWSPYDNQFLSACLPHFYTSQTNDIFIYGGFLK